MQKLSQNSQTSSKPYRPIFSFALIHLPSARMKIHRFEELHRYIYKPTVSAESSQFWGMFCGEGAKNISWIPDEGPLLMFTDVFQRTVKHETAFPNKSAIA